MFQDKNRTAPTNALVAVAAGAASALLVALAARGTWAGLALSYFAPLPLMIATLGFGFAVGGAAVLVGAVVAGVLGSPLAGLLVGAGLLLPSYLVCVAAMRAPSTAPDDRRVPRVVMVAMIFAAASACAVIAALIARYGSDSGARTAVVAAVVPAVRAAVEDSHFPGEITPEELARLIVGAAPALIAASTFFMMTMNIYVAGRVAAISGQIAQPWPQIVDTLALPGLAAGLFALACGLIFLGGLPGTLASVAASALACGFAVEGLAVIHALTRGMGIRAGILSALYALLICLPPWPLAALALVGFVDAAFHLRRRKLDKPSPEKP